MVSGRTEPTRRPTIPDVARAAGVSQATAARALGGYGAVSEASREAVLRAAEELGYRANRLARSMITGRTNTLGAVVADIENPFFATAMRGFSDVARTEGYEVILTNVDEDVALERKAVQVLLETQVDGLLVAPAAVDDLGHLLAAGESGTQLVLLDRRPSGRVADCVLIDSRKAAHAAVSHLVEQGHRDIAIVLGVTDAETRTGLVSTTEDRIAGYRDALEAAGLPVREEYMRLGDFHRAAAAEETRALLGLADPPTAVFATDSIIALGVLTALQSEGLRWPDDMSVIGFDDADWADVVRPALTVIAQPAYDLGTQAARRLIARIRGDRSEPRDYFLPTAFVERASVGPPKPVTRRA